MTNKEIAERIDIAMGSTEYDGHGGIFHQLRTLRNELDPSLPNPGTVVWWQDTEGLSDPTLGQVNEYRFIEMFGTSTVLDRRDVKWWPARIAGPDEVVIPLEIARNCCGNSTAAEYMQDEIRRAEAARREAGE